MKAYPFALLLLITSGFGCGSPKEEKSPKTLDIAIMSPPPPPGQAMVASESAGSANADVAVQEPLPVATDSSKIIYNSNLTLESASPCLAEQKVRQLVKQSGGYITSFSTETQAAMDVGDTSNLTSRFTLRIPTARFEATAQLLGSIGRITSREVSTQDVTEEYYDTQARSKARHALEERYLQVLKQARNVKEIMEVESKLSDVRSEIEQMEGRMRYLKNQVSYSTIYLTVTPPTDRVVAVEKGFFGRVVGAINSGFKGLETVFLSAITLLPSLLLISLFVWLIINLIRRFTGKRKATVGQ